MVQVVLDQPEDKMKKALVTGGCGFIGSNLTRELVKQGWQVDIVDNMTNGHLELIDDLNLTLPLPFSPPLISK